MGADYLNNLGLTHKGKSGGEDKSAINALKLLISCVKFAHERRDMMETGHKHMHYR